MKIALVQFYSYHEEILSPQIHFLLPDNELFLAAPPDVFENYYIKAYEQKFKKIFFSGKKYDQKGIFHVLLRFFSIFAKYLELFRRVNKYKIDLIVFNTLTGYFHFLLIKLFFGKIPKIHIIHNAQLFIEKKHQKYNALFKKNLFISLEIYHNFIENYCEFINPSCFDWFFPSLAELPFSYRGLSPDTEIPQDKIIIVVPGSVENNRRNYQGLFEALGRIKTEPPFVVFLLGRISEEDNRIIGGMGIGHIVKTFTDYIPGDVFLYYVRNADAIAFLIDNSIGDFIRYYGKFKTAGSSVLCLSFNIPCIISHDFSAGEELAKRAVYYSGSGIGDVFDKIISGEYSKEYFNRIKSAEPGPEYSAAWQREHYRKAIGVSV
jgi:hypothetical protein